MLTTEHLSARIFTKKEGDFLYGFFFICDGLYSLAQFDHELSSLKVARDELGDNFYRF